MCLTLPARVVSIDPLGAVVETEGRSRHALNCLVGPGGNGYDAAPGDPCKGMGNGAVNDVGDARKKALLQKAVDAAQAGIAATDVTGAQEDAAEVESLVKQAQ